MQIGDESDQAAVELCRPLVGRDVDIYAFIPTRLNTRAIDSETNPGENGSDKSQARKSDQAGSRSEPSWAALRTAKSL